MSGKAWVFGDNIDTDILAPGLYMKGPLEQLAAHCLEAIDPDFAANVSEGDVIVGGENFGIGSSREQAVQALQFLGIQTIIAKSFGGIFFRNALNFGVVALVCKEADNINPYDRISCDPGLGVVTNLTSGATYECEPIPKALLNMVEDGGLVPHLEKKLTGGPAAS